MDYNKPIFKKFTTISQLPSLPGVLLKLIHACNQDTTNMGDVSGIIETDPSLASRILRLVNSAQYAIPYKVENMRQAVSLTGMSTIKNLALCASINEVFRNTRKDAGFDLNTFWWHSLLCGLLAKRLAEATHYEKPEEAFLCGLFHDIGKLVLWTCFGDNYTQIISEAKNQPDALLNAELHLGVTHPEAGAWLLHYWGLPSFISDAVLYHHESAKRIGGAFPLVKLVYCAHDMCVASNNAEKTEFDSAICENILKISLEDSNNLLEKAHLEIQEVARALNIKVKKFYPDADATAVGGIERLKLTREVRDLSLLKGTLESLLTAQDQPEIIRVLIEGIQILFDRTSVLIFLLDDERKSFIQARPPHWFIPFPSGNNSIPLEQSHSLIVRCMRENRPINSHAGEKSFPPETPIMDDQIMRHLGKEGIYCIPMRASGVPVGVLVLAMDASEQTFFTQQENVFLLFAQQAGLALLTERLKRKNQDEIQKERLNAIYTFARNVAHEVRSPLSIIKNYLHILSMKIEERELGKQEIRIINEEIDRVSNIMDQLSTLSSNNNALVNEQTNVNRVINDLAKLMEESLSRNSKVNLHLDLGNQIPAVKVSRDALKQVIINLVRNSVEAMKDGGDLTISTTQKKTDELKFSDYVEKMVGDAVEISVTDNGPGIPESLLARVFEPFVSTKKGEHSGLGLSIVHSLVSSWGGRITCENNPKGGAAFRVLFPLDKTLQ